MNLQAVSADQAGLTILGVEDFSYSHFRTLAKLGVAWENESLKLGLNVTTPSLGLFGSGEAGYTISRVGIDPDGNGVPDAPLSWTAENGEDLTRRVQVLLGHRRRRRLGPGGHTAGTRAPSGSPLSAGSTSSCSRPTTRTCSSSSPRSSRASSTSGSGWSTSFENGVARLRRRPHGLLAATGRPGGERRRLELEPLPPEQRGEVRLRRQPLHPGRHLLVRRQGARLPLPLDPPEEPSRRHSTRPGHQLPRVVVLLGFLFGDAK